MVSFEEVIDWSSFIRYRCSFTIRCLYQSLLLGQVLLLSDRVWWRRNTLQEALRSLVQWRWRASEVILSCPSFLPWVGEADMWMADSNIKQPVSWTRSNLTFYIPFLPFVSIVTYLSFRSSSKTCEISLKMACRLVTWCCRWAGYSWLCTGCCSDQYLAVTTSPSFYLYKPK